MLNKRNRISNRRLIQLLFNKGKLYKNNYFVLKYLPAQNSESQFAVAISKKIIKKAVSRNRLKRQIMEAIRLNLNLLRDNFVILVITRPPIVNLKYTELQENIIQFFNHISSNAKR